MVGRMQKASGSRDRSALLGVLRREAHALGFDALGVAPAALPGQVGLELDRFLEAGFHGDMAWMEETKVRRRDPRALWPDARSVIALAMSYAPEAAPLAGLARPMNANLSVYARNRDYHDVVKPRLKQLAGWLIANAGGDVKVFVDTAPLMEKPLAACAGLGWQGKHSNLLSRSLGNWFFLGFVVTTLELPPDLPAASHCGRCRACLDICPTDAFPAPYRLDARRCISYLTIEHKGPIPHIFRPAIGNRIYGCDDCLAVCPWNKFAVRARDSRLQARSDLIGPHLCDLAMLDDRAFRALFSGSPVKRIGHSRFLRNVLIALGNAGDKAALNPVLYRLKADHPLVRGAAVWAVSRLDRSLFAKLRHERLAAERDSAVRLEWLEEEEKP